ncbi:MAG: peptidylprolyl isomerase, partial [Spirochaetota bacterium]
IFSRRKFREASNAFKLSVRQEIKETTLKQRYVGDIVSVETSTAEKTFIKAMAQYERSLEFTAFPFDVYPDSERLVFAAANPDKFRRVKLSKVTLTSSIKEAGEVLERVRSGALSFEEAARNHSKDAFASKGGDLGWQYAWEIRSDLKDPAVTDELFALSAAEVSKVYETVAGSWAFYRIDEAGVAVDLASDDLLRTVTDYMNRFERGSIEDWGMAQAKVFSAEAATDFAGAASAHNLTVKETNAFPLNYGGAFNLGYFALLETLDTQSNTELAGANTNEVFLKAIFSLEAGQVSEPLMLDNAVVVARVLEIRSADESTLGLIDAYYPSIVQDGLGKELTASILKSPKLKDDFFTAFSLAFDSSN